MAKSKGTAEASASDAYMGMLWLSLIATLTGIVFLFLDYNEYSGKTLPKVSAVPTAQAPALDQGTGP